MNNWFLSSTESGDLSLTLKGLLASVIPLAIVALQHFHILLSADDITNLVAAITGVATAGTALYGVLRKIDLAFQKRNAVTATSTSVPPVTPTPNA